MAQFSLTPPTFTVDLDGNPYTTRPFTNAVKASLQDHVDARSKAIRAQQMGAVRVQAEAIKIDNGGGDLERFADLQNQVEDGAAAIEAAERAIAIGVLLDEAGKPVTAGALDGASTDLIGDLVRVVLGEDDAPDPTKGNTDAS